MQPILREVGRRTGTVLLTAMLLSSCTTENVVYRNRDSVNVSPAAANFVGYSDVASKQTVCGTCHTAQQSVWKNTGHASAFMSLAESGHASASCESCHAVSQLGNLATTDGGWTTTKDPRYQDVQCESCHGAGLNHVTAPALGNTLLASIAVDPTAKTGCAECHTGTHEPFVDQWKVSAHSFVSASPAGRPECASCHTGQAALTSFGVTTNYTEKGGAAQAITCVVCHDPHANNIGKQLRFSIATPDTAQNLCMKCHNRGQAPSWTSTRPMEAHAPETGTLLGYSGWFPDGFMAAPTEGGTIIATHGGSANTRTCATCHVARYAVNDPKTGSFVFQATGHTFNATPCLDAQNRPLATNECAITARSFAGCTGSGCHGSENAARSALQTAQTRIETLTEELEAMLAKVPAAEKTTPKKTVARGALFNANLAAGGHSEEVLMRMGGNVFAGPAAHNPFLIEQLLTNSIKAVQAAYGVAPKQGVSLDNLLSKQTH